MATTETETGFPARLRAVGPLGLALATMTATIVLVCAITSLGRIGTAFPGFFVWENLFVPAVGEPAWTGVVSGLQYHSWLEEADGRPLETVNDLALVLEGRGIGDAVTYRAARGGRTYDVRVPIMALDLRAYAMTLGIYLFDAVVLAGLGLVLLYTGPRDPGVRGVFYFCSAQALYLSTAVDLFGPYIFREVYFLFAGLTPTATLYMISHFPLARSRGRWEDMGLAVCLLASLLFALASNASFFGRPELLLRLDAMVHVAMASSALAAFLFFARHFVRPAVDVDRERAKIVLAGSLGAFLPTMIFLVAFYVGGINFPFNFLALPLVLFPLGIGWAVARHDLFGVDRVIKRAIAYTATTAVLFAVYSLVIGSFDVLFENATQAASRVAEGALIATLIVVSGPSRRRLQEIVDRLYDRHRYDYREVVSRASQAFATELEATRLIPSALTLIDDALLPVSVRLATLAGDGVPVDRGLLQHGLGQERAIDLPSQGCAEPRVARVARALEGRAVLRPGIAAAADSVTADGMRALEELGAALAVALEVESRPVGLLVIGPRRAGGLHTSDDVALLRTVADQLAVALTNAAAYDTIDGLNRDLAGKNVDLENANQELRAAQNELVLKERLAAVGELAGAVAHTMRNPLAGMRATAQQAKVELGDHPTAEIVEDFIFETDRLSERIRALLDFSRPFEPHRRGVDMADLATAAVRAVAGPARELGVSIESDGPRGIHADVDPDLFEQLWTELLSNAVAAAGRSGRVVTNWGRRERGVWLEVRDNGPGVPEDKKSQLFRLFFTTKPEGTGIGLATVKKVADRHGALVEVFDAAEGGAGFRVVLTPR
jgi:signal transduction histidine kinase